MAMRPSDDFDRDIMDIIPERFDADADSRQARAGHRLRSIVTIAVAVVAVGAIVAAGLHFLGGRKGGGLGVPVIKADDKPIKIRPKPDDRGGMQVPNQDKLVYERMEQGADSEPKVERLLPQAEAPKAPPRVAPPPEPSPMPAPVQVAPAQPQRPTAPVAAKPNEPPNPKPAPAAKVASQPMEAPPAPAYQPVQARPAASEQVITPAQVASAPTAPPSVAAPVAPAKSTAFGDYVIQLGAVRAQDLAEKEWTRIQKGNADLLGALHSDIVRVELEGKGVFWRVRAAPLTEQSARQICAELAHRNQGCIVARK
ncbi:SPOR domain-containing protein [Paramagnetospirillum kuznetsovii]|uniref:SPOR domain-containing protein n=1 Tax=Paramagnetospirillum kuznetsovii TaxID=2053833 RepID=A0A364P0K1_9PROT|nr:SPOR domain-containing protein [Paramagnetospirillum kuznetsovii]RAU22645.1 SPOR domain-containing protein [Paramagnetospirillum kuznetsovii]